MDNDLVIGHGEELKYDNIKSSYCDFGFQYQVLSKQYNVIDNEAPYMALNNLNVGTGINLYETLVLNSKWDVRDSKNTSSIVLGRNHFLYEVFENYENKIENINKVNDFEMQLAIKENYDNKDIFSTITRATDLVANTLGIDNNYDVGTMMTSKQVEKGVERISRNQDVSVLDLLNRTGVRKYSENHFVVSGANLIFAEISVNEETINTVSIARDKFILEDGKLYATVLPVSNDNEHYGENVYEKSIDSTMSQIDYEDSDNELRIIEYISNSLLKELEYMYQGKIFCKYIEDIQIGDTVTLIDDVNKLTGIFRIETYEHVLDRSGMRTILNVKACVDLIDPVLDLYSDNIALSLYADLSKELDSDKFKNEHGINHYIKAVYNYYTKILLQNKRYCKFYHKTEQGLFDSVLNPIYKDNGLANPMAIKVIPMIRKGKEMLPRSLKSAFYFSPEDPINGIVTRIYKNLKVGIKTIFNDLGDWITSTAIYVADFLISIPTFGFHELLKAPMGMNIKKAIKNVYGENKTELNKEQIGIMANSENYSDWNLSTSKDKLTIGFFNVQAQQIGNLFPEIKNSDIVENGIIAKDENSKPLISSSDIRARINEKEKTIHKIIKDAFDIGLIVELYDGFSYEPDNYTIENFIENITPYGFENIRKEQIFENSYGSEFGVIINKKEIGALIKENKAIKILEGKENTITQSNSFESNRHFVETLIDVEGYNYGIKNLKVIWLHNLYGSKGTELKIRSLNVRAILDKYNQELSKDPTLGVIIMADLNLEIVNYEKQPIDASGDNMYLSPVDQFKNRITKPTTLDSKGQVKSNLYDNVLVSNNLEKINSITVNRFDYPYANKKIISDHIPVYVTLEKQN